MNDLADLFSHLIADRPGNFATRIVEALAQPGMTFPVTLDFAVGDRTYTVVIALDRWERMTVIRSVVQAPEGLTGDRPGLDFRGVPARWSMLERYRNANELDKAFRGHGETFDSGLPNDAA